MPLLKQEADRASQDRMSMARKTGEKMATRLLPPMMVLLLIVMLVIMVPAFMSF
jgi:hypothetical protein